MVREKRQTAGGYRSRESYLSQDPEKRARSLANLRSGRAKGAVNAATAARRKRAELERADVVTFAEQYLGLSLHPAQRIVLKGIYGLRVSEEEFEVYRTLTGGLERQYGLDSQTVEAVLCLGARSGKSLIVSIVALYEGIAHGSRWLKYLQPGETGYGILAATRQKQAEDIIQKNSARLLLQSPELSGWLGDEPLKAELTLKNGLKIISLPCNSTAGRGLPVFFLALDEVAHFFNEGPKADAEIYNSLFPRLAQFPGAKTLLVSTPAAKQGLFWDWFREGFQVPGRFTARAPTWVMNPTIPEEFLERAKRRDPDNYAREFAAEFAERLSSFFPVDRLEEAFTLAGDIAADAVDYVSCGSKCRSVKHKYFCGIDQSGLAGRDRFALAISHADKDTRRIKVDVCRSWDSKNSDEILSEIEALTGEYDIKKVMIDRYGAGWVTGALNKIGLEVEIRDSLPAVYVNIKSLMIAGRLDLPENGELREGLLNTTAYYGRNNALSISHERTNSGHADLADAVCTAIWAASREKPRKQIQCW